MSRPADPATLERLRLRLDGHRARALRDFHFRRGEMLAAFRVWLGTGPDDGHVEDEVTGTASVMRQMRGDRGGKSL